MKRIVLLVCVDPVWVVVEIVKSVMVMTTVCLIKGVFVMRVVPISTGVPTTGAYHIQLAPAPALAMGLRITRVCVPAFSPAECPS